ncbi:MAG: hypothetical protein IMZ61_06030 [Planctomycetes bacterium]|nr:hypothetical protein [Planctomycetota bacterium]
MTEKKKTKWLAVRILIVVILLAGILYFAYFPGRQAFLAFSLASGIGIPRIQARVDTLEEKAIKARPFSADDKHYLHDLFSCFVKGGRLTIVLRQTGTIMAHYLSGKGTPFKTNPRIFVKNKKVQKRMADLKRQVMNDLEKTGKVKTEYSTPTFYMPDPSCLDSMFGLYYGRLLVRPKAAQDGFIQLQWHAEVPWEWPSYESQIKQSGNPHTKVTIIPNALTLIKGQAGWLRIDDGLGEYLTRLGLAKPFLLYAEWTEELRP